MSERQDAVRTSPRTIAEALEAYGLERIELASDDPGLEAVLGIVGSFCDELAGAVLDPLAKRRLARRGGGAPACSVLDAGTLLRVLAPCARLFPYQIVAGVGVIGAFKRELPRLARWLAHNELGASADAARFRTGWAAALLDVQKHEKLQEAVEFDLFGNPPDLGAPCKEPETIVGRFHIERVTPAGVWVRTDEERRGPVRIPREIAANYHEGWDVSLAFRRAMVGWRLLASALPSTPGTYDRVLAEFAHGPKSPRIRTV